MCERIKYWATIRLEEGGRQVISIISDWLPDFFFFELFLLSLQWYSKTGVVRGLKDTHQIQHRKVGKMGNKRIKATEEIMEETGISCKVKKKVKLQGGKYLQATKYAAMCF